MGKTNRDLFCRIVRVLGLSYSLPVCRPVAKFLYTDGRINMINCKKNQTTASSELSPKSLHKSFSELASAYPFCLNFQCEGFHIMKDWDKTFHKKVLSTEKIIQRLNEIGPLPPIVSLVSQVETEITIFWVLSSDIKAI